MIRVAHPPGREPERRYAAEVLLGELLGLEHECVAEPRADVELTLAGHDGAVRLHDALLATSEADWLRPASLPATPLERLDGLPLLYGRDLLGGAFFLLTRYEEAVLGDRDEHGRFPAAASLAAREGFLRRPLVNEYAELLWQQLAAAWPRLRRRRRDFRLLPSHDVDVPFCAWGPLARRLRAAAGDLAKRRDPRLAAERVRGAGDPCDTFAFLLDASERAGVASVFFFLARHEPANRIGPGYALEDERVRALLREIHRRGHELGLHGSYRSHDEPELLGEELETLRRACADAGVERGEWGARQHYLRASPAVLAAYEQAGIGYDSSLGFADGAGFRAGICCEYPLFDLHARRRLALRERPLVAMDATVLQYERLREEAALEPLLELKRACRRFDGDFTLLWHNNRLGSRAARRLYLDVLAA